MVERIYHLTTLDEATAAQLSGEYRPKTFEAEGFIHCSFAHQILEVANLRFKHRRDLVLLEIDPSRLDCDVIEENLEGGEELFPHIYGRVSMSAVSAVIDFTCDDQGRFDLPEKLQ